MTNDDDEKWNVAIKVLVEHDKYREYRLPRSLSTDRNLLWHAKHEVGKRIADIIKKKKLKIYKLKHAIKHIEKSQTHWLTLAKSVNRNNENFFLNVLLASENNIEKFEHHNFFSNQSWTKHRDVSRLTAEEIDDLNLRAGDSEQKESCDEKNSHYDWVCKQINGMAKGHGPSRIRRNTPSSSDCTRIGFTETFMQNGSSQTKIVASEKSASVINEKVNHNCNICVVYAPVAATTHVCTMTKNVLPTTSSQKSLELRNNSTVQNENVNYRKTILENGKCQNESRKSRNSEVLVNNTLNCTSLFIEKHPVGISKKHGNVWEQRAAERAEKLLADKRTNQQQDCLASSSTAPTDHIVLISSKLESPQETPTGYSNKKSDNSRIALVAGNRDLPEEVIFTKEESHSSLDSYSNHCNESQDDEPIKMGNFNGSIAGNEKELSKTEQRAKRRQRVREKARLCAEQAKEEEKKVKEQKRIEHDLRIMSMKKEREVKHQLDFEKRKRDIDNIRRERDAQKRARRGYGPDPTRIKEMLKSRDRLSEHIREKDIAYRVIGSKLFLDKRISELAEETSMEINTSKYKMLEKYRVRITAVEKMNIFLVFVSYTLIEIGNTIKLDELMEYLAWKSINIDKDPESPINIVIEKAFELFCQERKPKIADCMIKALQFSESILNRISNITEKTDSVERAKLILKNYRILYDEAVDFMGITSYLRTRLNTEFFVMEEDYLLTVTQTENSGYRGEKRNTNESDEEEEYDKPEVQDMSCQTDGEPYDVKAASLLPRLQ
ncbi:Coiled-coil domain-containing protein [Caenorhabditis elegans]|uniref:Coiled-coil domain-containing protein n=1 Tax=Caenorhabditis elegans TaxID=6239 RepID=Q3HKB7_CAEEL|nr:Coiled-coil domain-containing protein [Caenorhabditis elegans]CCD62780.2 Coiled-coil domain-containing protein [Caenorhabditis elegans]|eukprot:NP_508921.3 Uncharacterized protein CELE_C41A3.2 [Caenorhabditis elegans]